VSLVTRCPECDTTFRVQAAQLSARGGRVRCGKCNCVFDGLAQIVEDEAATPLVGPSPQLPLFDPSRLAAEGRRSAAPPAEDRPAASVAARRVRRAATPESGEAAFLARPRRRAQPVILWSLLALLALIALAVQVALHFRTDLILLLPQARPHFEVACDMLDCEVHLPRQPELIGIESSELRFDKSRDGVIRLTALVRNRATFPQEFPALELTLMDENDQPVVRRVLLPADYLGAQASQTRLGAGIAPGSEELINVELDLQGPRAAGFRLYLFYPETPSR